MSMPLGPIAFQEKIPYSIEVAASSTSGTTQTVTLANRSTNIATIGAGVEAATITLPAATPGKMRDFFANLTVETATAPTLTFIDPATSTTADVPFGAKSLADIAPGRNLILFTEIATAKWIVSVKHEDATP